MQVTGSANVNIYGGTFDGRNGGLFVRGQMGQANATVKIYSGSFGNEGSQDGINVYEFANVYLGAYTDSELTALGYNSDAQRRGLIKCWANLFTVAMNSILPAETIKNAGYSINGVANFNSNIFIYYGTYNVMTQTDRHSRGIGAIDTLMRNLKFYLYNYGTLVAPQTGINASLIRFNDDEKNNAANGINFGYSKSGATRYYDYTGTENVILKPNWA